MRQAAKGMRGSFWVTAVLLALGSITSQTAYGQENSVSCTQATLHGRYVFDATGYNIVNEVAVPKTVVEFLTFKGDGNLTSLATVVVGGNKIQDNAPGTGTYTVNDDCTGVITFGNGFTFDLFIAPDGRTFHMIQTVTGQMIAGKAQKVSR